MSITTLPPVVLPGPPDLASGHNTNRKQLARLGWMFTSPGLLVVGLVTLFPIAFAIVMSLSNVTVTGSGFSMHNFPTWSNYALVLQNASWQYAVRFTLFFTFVSVIIELVLGTCIALVLERLVAGRGWMMALLLIPWSLITVISAQLWRFIYDPSSGISNRIFLDIGFKKPPSFLGSPDPAIIGMIIADVWKTTPFVAIIVLAGLVMIPSEMYEAAEVDGASAWTTFWRVTLPLLRPTLALSVMFRVLQAFGLFDLPYVLTNGGPGYSTSSLAVIAYDAMFEHGHWGPGAAVATTTTLLVLIGCIAALKVFRQQVGDER